YTFQYHGYFHQSSRSFLSLKNLADKISLDALMLLETCRHLQLTLVQQRIKNPALCVGLIVNGILPALVCAAKPILQRCPSKGRSSSPCYRPPSALPGRNVWCLIERYAALGYLLKLYGGQRVIEKRGFLENICPDYLLSENAYFPTGSDPIPIQ